MRDTAEVDSRYRAMGMLEYLCAQHTIQLVVVHGDPISKARPRFSGKGHAYTPSKTVEGEKRIAARFYGIPKFTSNVAVACLFFRATRQRIDVDNLLKAVLDGGTRAKLWDDDSQVTALIGIVEHDAANPRSIICVGEHVSTLTRGDAAMISCEACGARFFPGGKQRRESGRWCSRECRMTLAAPVLCPGCGLPFKRINHASKYCSGTCRGVMQTRRAQEARATRTHCKVGHLLDDANTHVLEDGRRRCRKCQAHQATMYRVRRQLKSLKERYGL
jgi:Holliday junction resolvase RusA-like endonuclease